MEALEGVFGLVMILTDASVDQKPPPANRGAVPLVGWKCLIELLNFDLWVLIIREHAVACNPLL